MLEIFWIYSRLRKLTDRTHKDSREPDSQVWKWGACYRLQVHSLSLRLYLPGLRGKEKSLNGFTGPYWDQRRWGTWPTSLLSPSPPAPHMIHLSPNQGFLKLEWTFHSSEEKISPLKKLLFSKEHSILIFY